MRGENFAIKLRFQVIVRNYIYIYIYIRGEIRLRRSNSFSDFVFGVKFIFGAHFVSGEFVLASSRWNSSSGRKLSSGNSPSGGNSSLEEFAFGTRLQGNSSADGKLIPAQRPQKKLLFFE